MGWAVPSVVVDESLSLYYSVQGNGPPIVFIHPPVMGHQVFKHQKRLARQYRVILFDLPGHGKSSEGQKELTISNLAETLCELLNALEIENLAVCGFSHGTLIAQEFALKYPERVNSLILCSGYPEVNTCNIKALAVGGMALAQLNQMPLLARILAKTHRHYKRDEEELYRYALKAKPQEVQEYIKAGLAYTAVPHLHRLTMPVLLVYGSLEKMNHRYYKLFAKEIPHLQLVVVKGATHQLPPQFFHTFNGIIHQFLLPLTGMYKN